MWPLLTSSTACRNVASLVSFRTVTRHCRNLFGCFEAWWNSGFTFSMLLADKPNFCAEKHAKWIFVWSVVVIAFMVWYCLSFFFLMIKLCKLLFLMSDICWVCTQRCFWSVCYKWGIPGPPKPGSDITQRNSHWKSWNHHTNTRLLRDVSIHRQFTVWN